MKKRNQNVLKWLMLFAVMLMGTAVYAADIYLDRFDTKAYDNNDGTEDFDGDWIEQNTGDQNATSGTIQVTNTKGIRLKKIQNDANIRRKLDLSAVPAGEIVSLSFDYIVGDLNDETLSLQLYNNNTSAYDEIKAFTDADGSGTYLYELSTEYIF